MVRSLSCLCVSTAPGSIDGMGAVSIQVRQNLREYQLKGQL